MDNIPRWDGTKWIAAPRPFEVLCRCGKPMHDDGDGFFSCLQRGCPLGPS